MSTTTTTVRKPDLGDWLAHLLWNKNAAGVEHSVSVHQGAGERPRTTSAAARIEIGTAISEVLACIKNHESGAYDEHSHLRDGSGAYQIIPQTWQYWSIQAGYGHTVVVKGKSVVVADYEYAYEAPANVQDAVVQYMLLHGGAGNWSPRYGNDPCTVGMGG